MGNQANHQKHVNPLSLTRNEATILELLVTTPKELFGLEMVDASAGELKRGTIYVILQRMLEKGLIDSKQEPRTPPEVGIPRRLYWVTGSGERVFRAYAAARSVLASDLVTMPG